MSAHSVNPNESIDFNECFAHLRTVSEATESTDAQPSQSTETPKPFVDFKDCFARISRPPTLKRQTCDVVRNSEDRGERPAKRAPPPYDNGYKKEPYFGGIPPVPVSTVIIDPNTLMPVDN